MGRAAALAPPAPDGSAGEPRAARGSRGGQALRGRKRDPRRTRRAVRGISHRIAAPVRAAADPVRDRETRFESKGRSAQGASAPHIASMTRMPTEEAVMDGMVKERVAAARPTELDPRWTSVVTRDRSADGTFYYSVETTGVSCRPSCAARLANPKNVQFHLTCDDAERAGFRACKRCKPDQLSLEGTERRQGGGRVPDDRRRGHDTGPRGYSPQRRASAPTTSIASSRRSPGLRLGATPPRTGPSASGTNSRGAIR